VHLIGILAFSPASKIEKGLVVVAAIGYGLFSLILAPKQVSLCLQQHPNEPENFKLSLF